IGMAVGRARRRRFLRLRSQRDRQQQEDAECEGTHRAAPFRNAKAAKSAEAATAILCELSVQGTQVYARTAGRVRISRYQARARPCQARAWPLRLGASGLAPQAAAADRNSRLVI